MRILKIARRPRRYWAELYATRPDAAGLAYADQKRWFCDDFFGPVDTWETYLNLAGYEACDLISGVEPLDAAWTAEHGGGPETGFELLLRQVAQFDPEALVLEAIQAFSVGEIAALRQAAPRLRALIGVTGFDLRHRPELAAVDVVMTCMPDLVAFVREAGGKAVDLPWWFDPRVLARLPARRTIEHALSFIGSLDPGPHIHDDRRVLLRALSDAVEIDIFTNVETRFAPLLARYLATAAAYGGAQVARGLGADPARLPFAPLRKAATWTQPPRFPYDRALYRRIKPSFYGIRMYEILRASRASLNFHITLAGRYAANMRMFEATGAGACLLTDWKENLGDFFADDEVVSYRSLAEARDKARWLIDHPAEADAIAARGHARTLRSHGFDQRVPLVAEAIGLAAGR